MKNLVKTFEAFEQNPEMTNPEMNQAGSMEIEHYMFFGNLKTIKRLIDIMLEMDEAQVNQVLHNGHDWAADHIASAKDDIEEVADFLMNELNGDTAEAGAEGPIKKFGEEIDESAEGLYSCNECNMTYEAYECNEDMTCECGGQITPMNEAW
jgi:hypothetical protein